MKNEIEKMRRCVRKINLKSWRLKGINEKRGIRKAKEWGDEKRRKEGREKEIQVNESVIRAHTTPISIFVILFNEQKGERKHSDFPFFNFRHFLSVTSPITFDKTITIKWEVRWCGLTRCRLAMTKRYKTDDQQQLRNFYENNSPTFFAFEYSNELIQQTPPSPRMNWMQLRMQIHSSMQRTVTTDCIGGFLIFYDGFVLSSGGFREHSAQSLHILSWRSRGLLCVCVGVEVHSAFMLFSIVLSIPMCLLASACDRSSSQYTVAVQRFDFVGGDGVGGYITIACSQTVCGLCVCVWKTSCTDEIMWAMCSMESWNE